MHLKMAYHYLFVYGILIKKYSLKPNIKSHHSLLTDDWSQLQLRRQITTTTSAGTVIATTSTAAALKVTTISTVALTPAISSATALTIRSAVTYYWQQHLQQLH